MTERDPEDAAVADVVRLTAHVSGTVQGVGFRMWTQQQARALGLVGVATNLPDGRVEIVAEGAPAACRRLLEALHGSTPGTVVGVGKEWDDASGEFDAFRTR